MTISCITDSRIILNYLSSTGSLMGCWKGGFFLSGCGSSVGILYFLIKIT